MIITNLGKAFIAREEAFVDTMFLDRGTPAIGFSHHGVEAIEGATWTLEQGVTQLEHDCGVNAKVLERVIRIPLHPYQWDALHTLSYNFGAGTVSRHPMMHWLNLGNIDLVADLFLGFENPVRRERERRMFRGEGYTDQVNGVPFGKMLYYRGNPRVPKPDVQTVVVPWELEAHAGI